MIVYRLTTGKYAEDISGEGAKLFGGRFNPVGIPALYTSEYVSLCILEILVRASKSTAPDDYTLVAIDIPDGQMLEISLNKLKKNWQNHPEYTQGIGEDFLNENQALCLKVPSAIVPMEHNIIINPRHPLFKKVKVNSTKLLNLDKRLFKP